MFRKKKPNTNVWALLGVSVLGVSAMVVILQESQKPLPGPSEPLLALSPSQMATVSLDFGDGKKREFRGATAPGMSALDALSISAEVSRMRLAATSTKDGVYIAMIDGKKADKKKQWRFYVNGSPGQDPAAYQIKAGDKVEWRYQ